MIFQIGRSLTDPLLMASTTCPSTNKLLLIAALSAILSLLLPVLRLSSDPARSMRIILPSMVRKSLFGLQGSMGHVVLTFKLRIAWDRLECKLRLVLAVDRFRRARLWQPFRHKLLTV